MSKKLVALAGSFVPFACFFRNACCAVAVEFKPHPDIMKNESRRVKNDNEYKVAMAIKIS